MADRLQGTHAGDHQGGRVGHGQQIMQLRRGRQGDKWDQQNNTADFLERINLNTKILGLNQKNKKRQVIGNCIEI